MGTTISAGKRLRAKWEAGEPTWRQMAISHTRRHIEFCIRSDGSVLINEYNWGNFHRFNSRTVAPTIPSRYLHF